MNWDRPLKLHELAHGPVRLRLTPDETQRAAVAKRLGLVSLPVLTAELVAAPWLDGVEITGRLEAVVEQVCGVSLDTFEQALTSELAVRAAPVGSPHGVSSEGKELALDPDAPDPPDVLATDSVDVAGYVVEHLALELDPFPRKPGVTFDYEPPQVESSPFAALKKLTDPKA